MRDILESIIQNFQIEQFINFFRQKHNSFQPRNVQVQEYQDGKFTLCHHLGEIPFSNVQKLVIYAFGVNGSITERSSKKLQYEKGKHILRQTQTDAGIFIFYDESGNFRFSLVHANYLGTQRSWSSFKRYTYFVSKDETNRTFLQQIGEADFSSLASIKEAFSVEKVTKEFYEAYKYAINEVIIKTLDSNAEYNKKHTFAQQLLSRILFIYFLQKKKWLKWKNYEQDTRYIKNLWIKYKQNTKSENTFYSSLITSLFFGAFNKKTQFVNQNLPIEIQESYKIMPYLNGGLFTETELDKLFPSIPDSVFEWIFELEENNNYKGFLEIFNFTIDEASPLDMEVAVDPEMLGKVYESLIAEQERGSAGIFYTPRVEIEFICRLSLVEYLASQTELNKEKIIDFVFDPYNKVSELPKDKLGELKNFLDQVKIVDPAVGSASFLVGMLNILIELHTSISKQMQGQEENLFALKHKIIQENLYGEM